MRFLFLCLISLAFAKPIVSVSIPPQAYFVRQIAGDLLEIQVVIPPNTDEHNFELKPQTMQALEKSDVYFTIGLELESVLLPKLQQYQNMRIVPTNEGLASLPNMHGAHHHEHAHKPHEHGTDDPHTWLDPILVQQQARIIADSLGRIYPENVKIFEKNLADFSAKLAQLDAQIREQFKGKRFREFIIYHPSWGYFAHRYDLRQIPIEIEGKEPKPRDLQRLMKTIERENFRAIFVQQGFPDSLAKTIAQSCRSCNIEILTLDHLAEDWEQNLLESARKIAQSLQ